MTDEDAPAPAFARPLRLAELSARRPREFDIAPTADEAAAIARQVGIRTLRKARFSGRLVPEGRADWRLEAQLGATVVQDCVATLAPVTTRIDDVVIRRFLADPDEPEATEMEMPDDDSTEPLGPVIDPAAVMVEALTLALPLYPRAEDAPPADVVAVPPGATPIAPRENPFAALSALRDRLPGADGRGGDDAGGAGARSDGSGRAGGTDDGPDGA